METAAIDYSGSTNDGKSVPPHGQSENHEGMSHLGIGFRIGLLILSRLRRVFIQKVLSAIQEQKQTSSTRLLI